jgi:hypothetical protein
MIEQQLAKSPMIARSAVVKAIKAKGLIPMEGATHEIVETTVDGKRRWYAIDLTAQAIEAAGNENDPDPNPKAEEVHQAAIEAEAPQRSRLVPLDAVARILGMADAIAATRAENRPPKAKRRGLTTPAWEAVKAGRLPDKLVISSGTNGYAQKVIDQIYALAEAGDRTGLEALTISGTNCYARAARDFRDACAAHLRERADA